MNVISRTLHNLGGNQQLDLFKDSMELKSIRSLDEISSSKEVLSRLANINWDFTNDKTTYLTHDIHPYPAKFIPQIPRYLILNLTRPGETIWDPFGGSGTTALEAILLNRKAISTDSNPLAAIIGEAKTTTLSREEELDLLDWLEKISFLKENNQAYKKLVLDTTNERNNLIPNIKNLDYWFDDAAIIELAFIKSTINNLRLTNQKKIALVAFSRTIFKVSNQESETRYANRKKNISSKMTIEIFTKELMLCLEKAKELGHLLNFKEVQFATCDLRQQCVGTPNKKISIPRNSVDLIVTSPPYPNANDYYLYHRFRLFWLGFDPRKLASIEIGSHLRHQKENTGFECYLSEMKESLKNFYLSLRPGRFAVLVLGDGVYKGKTYATTNYIKEVASKLSFEIVCIIDRKIHKTKRSFSSAARRAKNEQLLILRKPKAVINFFLYPPNYKPWLYEEKLRRLEIERILNVSPKIENQNKLLINCSTLKIDRMKRLTFSHGFSSKEIEYEPTWQALIENGNNSKQSNRKSSNYVTHGLHSYKGKFYPQLAKSLINVAQLDKGSKVLDPFCGSGTLLLEGYLNGLKAFGCDSNPLAVKIASGKTKILAVEPYVRDRMLSQLLSSLNKERNNRDYEVWLGNYSAKAQDEIIRWFPKEVLVQIANIFEEIKNVPHPVIQEFLEVIFSSIIRKISQQDPHDLRVRRRKKPLINAPVIQLFLEALKIQRKRLLSFNHIQNSCPLEFGETDVWEGDSRYVDNFISHNIKPNSIDAIITSPPYATALPYIDTDRLSLLLLFGMSSCDRRPIEMNLTGTREITSMSKKSYEALIEKNIFNNIDSQKARVLISRIYNANKNANVGFRRKNQAALLYKYYDDITLCLRNFHNMLKKQSFAFFILGDNITKANDSWIPIETINIIKEIGKSLKWKLIEDIKISVTRENYKHLKNSITENSILWFQKLN